MAYSKEEALAAARKDLAKRLGVDDNEISVKAVEETEFPDTALGAGGSDEMSGQMLTSGWRIRLEAKGQKVEYRANKHQLRLYNFKGSNYQI
jgi:hypothetical protein